MPNPITTTIPSKSDVAQVDEDILRAMLQARMVLRATVAELRTWEAATLDEVIINGALFDRDPADTTSADDGSYVIVSLDGARFKRRAANGYRTVATATLVGAAAATLATGALTLTDLDELYIRVAADHNQVSARTLRFGLSPDGTTFTPIANIATFSTGGGVINRGTVRIIGLGEALRTVAGTLSSGSFGAFTHARLDLDSTGNLSVGTLMEIKGR